MEQSSQAVVGPIQRRVRRQRWPRHYAVASPRNSRCGSAKLKTLNFDHWFTDNSFDMMYLHVHSASGDGSIHRVTCAYSSRPRLQWNDGSLWWLVDKPHGGLTECDMHDDESC
jgi:hypothetical protein